MKVFFSNTSKTFLQSLASQSKLGRWIYLGKDVDALERLKSILGEAQMVDYSYELYEMSANKRKTYIDWIDQISRQYGSKIEWMFGVTSVKNPYSSQLFLNFCYLSVLKKFILQKENISFVIVDSPALMAIIHREWPELIQVKDDFSCGRIQLYIEKFLRVVFRLLKSTFSFLHLWFCIKLSSPLNAEFFRSKVKKIYFIRNYISGEFSVENEGPLESHFFPGLYNFLQYEGAQPVFLCVPIRVKSYLKLFQQIRKSSKRIIIINEILTLSDLLFALMCVLRSIFLRIKAPQIDGFDLNRLINEEHQFNVSDDGFIQACLFSRFGMRLKEKGMHVDVIINWAENQAFEKGLICGLKKSFPECKVIASQPFLVPDNHISMFLTQQDEGIQYIPDRILVTGAMAKNTLSSYYSKLNIDFTPAFRYKFLLSESKKHDQGKILGVFMGFTLINAINTLKILFAIKETLTEFDRVLIKLHPVSFFSKEKLLQCIKQSLPKNFQFTEEKVEVIIPNLRMGLCGATGTAVELISQGIPTVVVAESNVLTMNYIGCKNDPDLWQMCFNLSEVKDAIVHLCNSSQNSKDLINSKTRYFRDYFFAKQENELWKNYLFN